MTKKVPARPQLAHVAKAAEVSVSTASACLRDAPGPSQATRERVKAIAADLGYRTNLQAKALRDGQLQMVAFVFEPVVIDLHPRAPRLFWQRLVNSILQTLTAEGIALVMLPANSLDSLRGVAIDAVILASLPNQETTSADIGFGIPVVATGPPRPGRTASCFVGHNSEVLHRIGLDIMYRGGARRIALIPNISLELMDYETSVYRQWCAEHGMPATVLPLDRIWNADEASATVETSVREGIDGFLIRNCDSHVVLNGIKNAGKTVPADVQIVSESEGTIDAFTTPPVTSVSLMGWESGRIIADEVIRQIRNPRDVSTTNPNILELPYELTVRESTRELLR